MQKRFRRVLSSKTSSTLSLKRPRSDFGSNVMDTAKERPFLRRTIGGVDVSAKLGDRI